MTLESLFELAANRLGSRDAVVAELGVSRQRLQDARRGGPPLRSERLVRLGLIAGVGPLEALRAGGRNELAQLLADAGGVLVHDTTADQRALLHAFSQLTERHQKLVLHIIQQLVSETPPPASGTRKRSALPSQRPRRAKR